MSKQCDFSQAHYKKIIENAKKNNYVFTNLKEFNKNSASEFLIILRHDIDINPINAYELAKIESESGIKATYFIRVHSNSYNPFGFNSYYHIKNILNLGHELGLHYEHLDFSNISGEKPEDIIKKEKQILETIFDIEVKGIAGHQDFTEITNWKFWQNNNYKDFGFDYDAYDDKFLNGTVYNSDSLMNWKAGKCICELIEEKVKKIYLVTHPDYWYKKAYHLETLRGV